MKLIFVLTLTLFHFVVSNTFAQQNDLVVLRNLCFKAFMENDPTDMVLNLERFEKDNRPVIDAYKSIAFLLEAKKSSSFFEKIKFFNRGKTLLEYSILSSISSIEIRFLRFCVQTSIPFFLGYSRDIRNDKEFIIRNWHLLNDNDLKERIKYCMINSSYCNEKEKRIFLNG